MSTITRAAEIAPAPAQPMRRYDIVKEFVVSFVVVAVLTALLAALFSSPDVKPITLAGWAKAAPNDFVATAAGELAGTSTTAGYGPPYNHTAGASQKIGPVSVEHWAGVTHPVDAARDFVLRPLAAAPHDAALAAALATYQAAPASQQARWAANYAGALSKAPGGDPAAVKPGDYGPVPVLASRLLDLARSGALDGALQSQAGFYNTDYTKSLMFIGDSTYMAGRADAQHLSGDQWGMMNETGNFPGQAWLWLYAFWYQIKPFSTSGNADALVWGLMALLSLGLVLVPFIPGLRTLPRYLGVYRLVWREHYRAERVREAAAAAALSQGSSAAASRSRA